MRYPESHYRWEWDLQADPEALWPLVSDTNRFNRETGLPALELPPAAAEAAASPRRRLRLRRFGVPIEWEEEPFEWVRPERFGVVRHYTRGPVAEMRVQVDLDARPEGGTRLVYQVWARPRNALGLVAVPAQIGLLSERRFAAIFRRYDRLAQSHRPPADIPVHVDLAPGALARLARGRAALVAAGVAAALVDRLSATLTQADDLTVARLRPYALADRWGVARRSVLELCLYATRAGWLDLRWDLLCPLCRGAKQTETTLRDVRPAVHCDSCNIDFTANFDRFVELSFRPNPGIREVAVGEFCTGGPQVTPHIVAQQWMRPGAERILTLPLEPGRYRLRARALAGGLGIQVGADGAAAATIQATPAGWPAAELQLALQPRLHLINATAAEQLLILERMAWSDQAVTAAEVTALQTFRDLFSSEALRPGDQIAVGTLAILFTDLRSSTRLYREIGDAPAFGLVMNHFDVLTRAIAAADGVVVKTIGDAVMGAFRRPVDAVRALLQAQAEFAVPTPGQRPLFLKAGIHVGPCIAVTLNDRLDYFGSTVNLAARLEGQSRGGDIVLSDAVYDDPEVAALLAESDPPLTVEPYEAALKGFEEMPAQLWRVSPASPGH